MIKYKNFTKEFIEEYHDKIYTFRNLYRGKHLEVFPRAKRMIEEGEVLDNVLKHNLDNPHYPTPYVMANICKMIVNTPAILVSRSIGEITSGLDGDEEQNTQANKETSQQIDGPKGSGYNSEILELQKELIKNIVDRSKLKHGHKMNITQQQMDGGLVGVPVDDERGLRIEFKTRDVYYPHDDEMGADLTYWREIDNQNYLQVYRERLNRTEEGDPFLTCEHLLFRNVPGGQLDEDPLPTAEAAKLLNMKEEEMFLTYEGRSTLFIRYWANDPTLIDPLGVSAISGQENRQDEINWTLTQTAQVFQRNGKPRLAINKELADALQKQMVKLYGESARGKFDHKMLEVVSMDDKGKSMEVIQIDISKLGGVEWVKDIIKMMLMETQTSEKAVDFYMGEAHVGAQSGVAKFYDLFLSLMKSEAIQKEYVDFIKELIHDALWIAEKNDPKVVIERPAIQLLGMLPIERKELIEENMTAYKDGGQSLETTIRMMNPGWSDEAIAEEVEAIKAEQLSQNSDTMRTAGKATLERFLDNPDTRPGGTQPNNPDASAMTE